MTTTNLLALPGANRFVIFYTQSAHRAIPAASASQEFEQNAHMLIARNADVKNGFAQRPAKGPF
jgi:hypothetical protein